MQETCMNWLTGALSMLMAGAAAAQETIKVALNISLSGPFANIGEL